MKIYNDFNIQKKIFLGNLKFKKYFNNDIFDLYYEEGMIITIMCKDEYDISNEEIDIILKNKKEIYDINYSCMIEEFKGTFIYNNNNNRYGYEEWINSLTNINFLNL